VDSRTGGWPEPRGRVAAMAVWCSIVIPARNDTAALALTLDALDRLEERSRAEIVVAACGDPAGTTHAARERVRLLWPESGTRAALMNAGAAAAGSWRTSPAPGGSRRAGAACSWTRRS